MRKLVSLVVVLGLLALAGTTIVGCEKSTEAKPPPPKTTIILIDRTDGILKEQQSQFLYELKILKDDLVEKDRLIIYDVPGDTKKYLKEYNPLYSSIVPQNPDTCNSITTTCKFVKENYEKYESKFSEAINNIVLDKTYDKSYILEAIRMISRTKEIESLKNKKFVIFSNMLQNSAALTHYRKYSKIKELPKDLYILDINNALFKTNVFVYMLRTNDRLQNKKLEQWWSDYFNIAKANSVTIQKF